MVLAFHTGFLFVVDNYDKFAYNVKHKEKREIVVRKDELEEKLSERHIELDENVKWTNEKMIKILGDYTISHSPSKLFCWGQRFLQSLETVQLCRHLKDEMKSFEKAGINPMESDDYVAEFKENGSRVFIYYSPEVGFRFFSRRESVSTFLNNELTDKILLIDKGIVSNPADYIGKYNYRFILDGEITVEGSTNFEGVEYGENVEDMMQSIIGALPERAKKYQLAGNRFMFNIFDCIYFEKAPTGLPPEVKFDYYAADKELNDEEVAWVESYFADYLRTAAFKGYKSAKKLYAYLYSLKDSIPNDLRKYPFIKRRNIRTKLVQFLKSKNLPFVEVDGEDKDKYRYLDEVLGEHCEGIILKNIYAPYISGMRSSRSHRACMKVKQSINSMLKDADNKDFDVFISGINPPKSDRIKDMIGALNCSIYINDGEKTYEHVIASVSGIPHDWKRELCAFNEKGEMVLNPDYYGKVISINGLALTAKLKFQHAVLFDKTGLVLKDKDATECTWDKEELDKLFITRGY